MEDKEPKASSYLKYSGLAFQMFFLLGLGLLSGSWADKYFGLEEPYLAMAFTFTLLIGFLVKLYLDVINDRI